MYLKIKPETNKATHTFSKILTKNVAISKYRAITLNIPHTIAIHTKCFAMNCKVCVVTFLNDILNAPFSSPTHHTNLFISIIISCF